MSFNEAKHLDTKREVFEIEMIYFPLLAITQNSNSCWLRLTPIMTKRLRWPDDDGFKYPVPGLLNAVWPVKSRQMSITSGQKLISLEKWKILKSLTNWLNMWQFGENNCCHRLKKVAQSAINRPIWSHCLNVTHNVEVIITGFSQKFVIQNSAES